MNNKVDDLLPKTKQNVTGITKKKHTVIYNNNLYCTGYSAPKTNHSEHM
jgi:hypothetical protein